MVLDDAQKIRLAEEIAAQWDMARLELAARDVGVNLPNIAPGFTLKQSVMKLVAELNGQIPPRTNEFLHLLTKSENPRLRTIAAKLLIPNYYSPTGDAHDAILLGRTAFVARDYLRSSLFEFTNPTPATTRVLIVRGNEPGGKSYSWQYLRHLASAFGAYAVRLGLKNNSYTPRELVEQVFMLLGLDRAIIPTLTDDPQLARIDPYINAFKGQLHKLTQRYWLVVDDINDPIVTPAMRETLYALAYSVEDLKPANLWIALIGYNLPIVDPDLRYIANDYAEFPTADLVANHLKLVAARSPQPLDDPTAQAIADLLFAKFPKKLDKQSMIALTEMVEEAGERLAKGQQP